MENMTLGGIPVAEVSDEELRGHAVRLKAQGDIASMDRMDLLAAIEATAIIVRG